MNNKSIIGLIVLLGLICSPIKIISRNLNLDNYSSSRNDQREDVRISQKNFDKLVEKFTRKFDRCDSIKRISDYIKLARLFNTIYYSELSKVKKYEIFLDLFRDYYWDVTVKRLDEKPQKGLSYDSEKYKISLGGDLRGNVFRIID